MATARIKDGRIWITTPYSDYALCASLPGARWSNAKRAWSCPATAAGYAAVCGRWDSLRTDAALSELEQDYWARQLARGVRDDPAPSGDSYQYHTLPWNHQVGATLFAIGMDAVLLHCHMGTGKTKITFDALRERAHETVLVLCPASVVDVWQIEAEKHAPETFDILPLRKGSCSKRADLLRQALGKPRTVPLVAVVNYEAAASRTLSKTGPLGAEILAHEWGALVLDESHRIKSPGAHCSRFCAQIKAGHKLALTGTPMPHSPLDIYGQYRTLDPAIFGTRFSKFRDQYAVMGGFEGRQVLAFRNQDELRAEMDRLRYTVTKDALDLPPLQTIDRAVQLTARTRKHYNEMSTAFVTAVEQGVITAANALAKLLRLQQITCGYGMVDGVEVSLGTEKRDALTDLFTDLAGENVVVFTRFRHDLDAVWKAAKATGRSVLEVSGRRHDYLLWKEGKHDTLAVQIQSGALGLDLTEASYAVFYSLGFSLGDYQQAVARVHRPGQTRPTIIYRLLAAGTVDQKITRAIDKRKQIVDYVIGEGDGAHRE